MWCTIITMATVGFGDYYPETHLGRIIAIMSCIWGNFLISLMVVSLTISSEFTVPAHRKAFDQILRTRDGQILRDNAARVIQSLYAFNLGSKQSDMTRDDRLNHLNRVREKLKHFQVQRKKLIAIDKELPLEN